MQAVKFKPMLSGKAPADLSKLNYPLLASPKLDGIRCIKLDGKALTRSLKPIPNAFVRNWVEANLPDGIDGELLLKDWTAPYRKVCSAIMSRDGEPEFTFAAFDLFDNMSVIYPFRKRLSLLEEWAGNSNPDNAILNVVPHSLVNNAKMLEAMMEYSIEQGFEGVMVRDPDGPYKMGRSTVREGYLLKIKLWEDEEAEVIGVVEQVHNANEAKTDALGHTERSTKKEGMVPAGTMGALKCRFEDGTEFEVGTGFDDELREAVWKSREEDWGVLNGETFVKVKHQPPPGGRPAGEKPRFPVFLGFRHVEDM